VKRLLAALFVYLSLAAMKTFPLIRYPTTHVPIDPADPLLVTWILSWVTHALATTPLLLFDANMFYPAENSLALSEHMLGVQPLFAPVYALSHNPLLGYNAVFFLSFALSALAGFWLSHHFTGKFWPSLVAGTLFGFAPFRFGQLSHLQLLNFFWAPCALLFLDRCLRTRRWRDLAAFAVFYWLQALSSVYLGYMITVAVAVYVGHYVFAVDRSLISGPMFSRFAVFLAGSIVVLGPAHLPYVWVNRAWGFERRLSEVTMFTPDLLSYLWAPPFMNDFYLRLFSPSVIPTALGEKWLFPGLVLPALAILGSVGTVASFDAEATKQLRRALWLIILAAWLISLGPYLIVFGRETGVPLPYLILYHSVPGFASMRAPGRFALLAVLAASPLAALGVIKCHEAAGRLFRWRHWRWVAMPVISVALISVFLLELGLKPIPLARVPVEREVAEVYRWLDVHRPGPVVELPFGLDMNPAWKLENHGVLRDYWYVYLSTVHWLPLANGNSGFWPPTYEEIRQTLKQLPAPSAVQYAAALGIRAIVVHTEKLLPEDRERWDDGALAAGLREMAVFGQDRIYAVAAVSTTSTLEVETTVPEKLPAGGEAQVGLFLHNKGSASWVHQRPPGLSRVIVRWTESRTRRVVESTARVLFPLVVTPGESQAVSIRVRVPEEDGIYSLQFLVPSVGLATGLKDVAVGGGRLPTSRDATRFLRAEYFQEPATESMRIGPSEPLGIQIAAINAGQAIWLARADKDKGVVALAWQWLRDREQVPGLAGRARMLHDTFPGQRYRFQLAIPSPSTPGTYTLELGLVSERVTWFSDVGTPPVRLLVKVRSASGVGFEDLVTRLRLPVDNPPTIALSAHRTGAAYRFETTWKGTGSPWVADAYFAMRAPDGSFWFYDGQRLVPWDRGWWIPLATGVHIPKDFPDRRAFGDVSMVGMPLGTYTYVLALTQPDSYRVIADARGSLEISP